MTARLDALDRALFDRIAAAPLHGTATWLRTLSRAADHGLLWTGTAAVLGAVGGRTGRRAALRGLGSLALASTTANTVAKHATRRPRPLLDPVPQVRRLLRQPVTTSFPSGHSASAAAFATGVAIESPLLGAAVAPLAAAVALSRVYTGAHYPGDVLAGTALGAAAAAATLHWWPRSCDAPPPAAPARRPAPALPQGRGLSVVVNAGSGNGSPVAPGPEDTAETLRTLLPEADVRVCGPEDDLAKMLTEAADRAARAGGALGVCGGDGSVNLAAALAVERTLPLAVFPGGTLNHFALDLGAATHQDTAEAVQDGSAVGVDLALATDDSARRVFVNTFSLGLYPELVRRREKLEKRIGKWPALAVAAATLLPTAEPVTVHADGRTHRLWLLFAGNGAYEPAGVTPTHRAALADGQLDVRVVDGSAPLARTRLVAALLTGTLHRSRVYRTTRLRALHLDSLGDATRMAVDGESVPARGALHLSKAHAALTVYRPRSAQSVPPAAPNH
ncbi:phosphatase PAP2 family protein [Kitasatospora sp. NPDC048545]|uniref:bifunctional phosphatase PAP2/diacylglycerol kinase family protein n=1 Tax=Kitasatospora sp. NPDC048545 TaxID=3157208 RepID=UPI0033ED3E5C